MIYSNDWRVYRNLGDISYEHEIVNHSVEFVNESSARTNNIEGFWSVWKANFKKMRGCCDFEICCLHLDEIMHRSQYPDTFSALVHDIAFFYTF